MKKFLYIKNIFIGAIAVMSMASCARTVYPTDTHGAREPDRKAFVEKIDGEVIEANEARLRMPLFKKNTIELDNSLKIPLKEVKAYQNNEAYYYRTPQGFGPRVARGLINMYYTTEMYQSYSGPTAGSSGRWETHVHTIYYVQKGNDAPLSIMNAKVVNDYVKDYQPAMDFMDLYYHNRQKARTKSVINTAAVVGGLIIGIASVSSKSNAMAVGGAGLFFGGLISGFVNKVQRAKNEENVVLAVNEYNMQTKRNKRR